MKIKLIIVFLLLVSQMESQVIDWKSSFVWNASMDYVSTLNFRKQGGVELNPVLAPLVNNDRIIEFSLVSCVYIGATIVLVDGIKDKNTRSWVYGILALVHGLCVLNNQYKFGFGLPLVVGRF